MAHHDSKPRLPRTVLADKYGTSGWADLRDILPMKSGLTPVHTKPQDTWEAKLIAEDVRWLQRVTNLSTWSSIPDHVIDYFLNCYPCRLHRRGIGIPGYTCSAL